jgi:hypothetical protein
MRRCAVAPALGIVGTAAVVATAGPGSPLPPGLQAAVATLGIDAERGQLVDPARPGDPVKEAEPIGGMLLHSIQSSGGTR